MNNSLKRTKGAVFSLRFHLIIVTKYRRKVLTPDIMHDFLDILDNIAAEYDFDIIAVKGNQDHIHMLLDLKSINFVPDVVKVIKGRSARILRQLHPELKESCKEHLWTPSYFIRTVSDADNQTVINYINSQETA